MTKIALETTAGNDPFLCMPIAPLCFQDDDSSLFGLMPADECIQPANSTVLLLKVWRPDSSLKNQVEPQLKFQPQPASSVPLSDETSVLSF